MEFEIIPVAFLQLNGVVELRIEEQKEIDKYTDKLNALKAYISKQERIEQMKEYNKHFRQENQEYFKQYREKNQEKI